jgi:hypothetical protein
MTATTTATSTITPPTITPTRPPTGRRLARRRKGNTTVFALRAVAVILAVLIFTAGGRADLGVALRVTPGVAGGQVEHVAEPLFHALENHQG